MRFSLRYISPISERYCINRCNRGFVMNCWSSMYNTGLLLLTQPLQVSLSRIPHLLEHVSALVSTKLYVHVVPSVSPQQLAKDVSLARVPCTKHMRHLVTNLYSHSASFCSNLDIQVLLSNIQNQMPKVINSQVLSKQPQVLILDKMHSSADQELLQNYLAAQFTIKAGILNFACLPEPKGESENAVITEVDEAQTTYSSVCVGGTFDRIHTGHKILLSETCLLARESITVGVTDNTMLKSKVVGELIEPVSSRLASVTSFLSDICPQLNHSVVPISDPYGPSITDHSLQAIVVSEETLKGGQAVNDKRKEKGMSELSIECIALVQDACHSKYEEEKVSSSSGRKRLLGTLLRPPQYTEKNLPATPYVIGLTGGIASGKSSVCKRLQGLGAAVVNCDKLGHVSYVPGTEAFKQIAEEFGSEVVGSDGQIDRKSLGKIVFSTKDSMQKLNSIVWPAIADLAQKEIQQHRQAGVSVVILDAAVLLEAGWDRMAHEVWTTFVPKQEAVKRIMERNKLSEEQATQRIESQIENSERIDRANVVLSTLFEYEYTQLQCEKAWRLLQERLPQKSKA